MKKEPVKVREASAQSRVGNFGEVVQGYCEEEALLDKDVLSIDVREEGRITVRTKPGAAQDYDKHGAPSITPSAGKPI